MENEILSNFLIVYVGPEGPRGFGPFHLKFKAHAEEEEVPGDEIKGIQPNCQNVLPRMTLSSAGQNHGRKSCHIARRHLLKDVQRDSKPYGLAIGE